MDESYYQRIKQLNVEHYAGEIEYYSGAPLRSAETALLNTLPPGATILDVGCGSGRFSIEAAKMGFQVTGIDITPEAIERCRARAKAERLSNADFGVFDITEKSLERDFDFIFCPRFVINAISTDKKRNQAIVHMLQACREGGGIFIESFNIWYLGKGFGQPLRNTFISIWRKVRILIAEHTNVPYSGLYPGDITYRANKAESASEGYAHLPSIFEIRSYLPHPEIRSIYEITGKKNRDWLKYFRYSIWVSTTKKM